MEKIRVLHCLETVGSGGVEQRRLSLARRLDPEAYEQQIVCTKGTGGLPDQFRHAGCVVHEVGEFRHILDPRPYRNALKVVRQFQPHVIHGAVYEGLALAVVAGTVSRVPLIVGEETVDPKNRRLTGHALYRLMCSLTHHLVAISPAVQDYLSDRIFNPSKKITLINNGVEERPQPDERAVELIRRRHGITDEMLVVGVVGRLLDKHKRISDLIAIMPSLLRVVPNVRLMIVGGGPDEQKLRRMAEANGVSDETIFVGYQSETRAYYEIMSIFALVSEYEGLPLVVLEAMFARLPVVASSVGGTPFVVEDHKTGFLVGAGDRSAIYKSLLTLLDRRDLRREMGGAGQKRARELFSADRYVSDVDRLYKDLLSERSIL